MLPQKCMECFRLLLEHLAWIEHQFLNGIKDSRKPGSLWGWWEVWEEEGSQYTRVGFSQRVRVTMLMVLRSSGRDSVGRSQHSSNRLSGISARTMHQSTTPSLSQTIWPRWASRQFLSLLTVQTLLPVTFGYSLSSEAFRYETIEEMKEAVTKVTDTLTQEDFHGAFQKSLERYKKCIAGGGDYFKGD